MLLFGQILVMHTRGSMHAHTHAHKHARTHTHTNTQTCTHTHTREAVLDIPRQHRPIHNCSMIMMHLLVICVLCQTVLRYQTLKQEETIHKRGTCLFDGFSKEPTSMITTGWYVMNYTAEFNYSDDVCLMVMTNTQNAVCFFYVT